MLHNLRVVLAVLMFLALSFLFLDFSGTAHVLLGWAARVQFLPALMALNFGVVALLIVVTLLFGRIYCSVVCPLGIMQDVVAFFSKKHKKNHYSYSAEKRGLRFVFLGVFLLCFILGLGSVVALLEPYSSFGRIMQNLFQPIYIGVNNLLALVAEHVDSYAFYGVEVWVRSGATFVVALATVVVIGVLAWRGGRTYCNTVCPVGTLLGYLAQFSFFAPVIDRSKCVGCRLCERNCKASCIDIRGGLRIDGRRCVDCFECVRVCPKGAVSFTKRWKNVLPLATNTDTTGATDSSRRNFLTLIGLTAATVASAQKEKMVDGGIVILGDKEPAKRQTPVVPPGAQSLKNFQTRCTGCQLCVSECPNHVLRPSTDIAHLMQPEMSFERGYCRPNCNRCSQVCPTKAIKPITKDEKSSVQIGHAVWVEERCIVMTDDVNCGNCARHCPANAIIMVPINPDDPESLRIPAVDAERCIGCGSCENVCPSRPLSAIFVEGHEVHKTI